MEPQKRDERSETIVLILWNSLVGSIVLLLVVCNFVLATLIRFGCCNIDLMVPSQQQQLNSATTDRNDFEYNAWDIVIGRTEGRKEWRRSFTELALPKSCAARRRHLDEDYTIPNACVMVFVD